MLSSPSTRMFSFMDDSYIMMRSNAWEKDCEKIAKVHNLLNSWAEENGVSFAPEKYSLFPNTKLGTVKYLPNIDNLLYAEKLFKKECLDILNIRVDNRLSQKHHFDLVLDKVAKQRRYLKCISGSTWGLSLFRMR